MIVAIVVILALLAAILWAAVLLSPKSGAPPRPWAVRLIITVGALVAIVRVGSLWLLLYTHWTGRGNLMSEALIPLLLYPEAYLVRGGTSWTPSAAVLFSALLVVGSFVYGSLLTAALFCLSMFRRK